MLDGTESTCKYSRIEREASQGRMTSTEPSLAAVLSCSPRRRWPHSSTRSDGTCDDLSTHSGTSPGLPPPSDHVTQGSFLLSDCGEAPNRKVRAGEPVYIRSCLAHLIQAGTLSTSSSHKHFKKLNSSQVQRCDASCDATPCSSGILQLTYRRDVVLERDILLGCK